ncbi:unnamed protein product [Gongylonema pulchrum]|uniref:DUF5655 domain-containing protein n=1 Tax=Gongylonema pulchrum TaxID=637853 RepID=A0A183DPD1_9BILA|nr:unnamed protein product [Gongylonema pulchrum]
MNQSGAFEKTVAMRLIKPTIDEVDIKEVLKITKKWKSMCGQITVHNPKRAKYFLVNKYSHNVYFAALILGKRSIRCKLLDRELASELAKDNGNKLKLTGYNKVSQTPEDDKWIEHLKAVLLEQGYQFVDNN